MNLPLLPVNYDILFITKRYFFHMIGMTDRPIWEEINFFFPKDINFEASVKNTKLES